MPSEAELAAMAPTPVPPTPEETTKADELRQVLEALKVPVDAPEVEVERVEQCAEWSGNPLVRCTKSAEFLLRWDGRQDWQPHGFCSDHTKQYSDAGARTKRIYTPPAEAPAGSTQVGPEETKAVEEVPCEEQCMKIFYGSVHPHAATGSCEKRAVAFLARNPEMKWCEEHLPEEKLTRKGETLTRIVDWVDGKPVGEPDPSPEAVVHQAEPALKEVSFKPAESGTEGLRVAIRELCQQRFGELTFVETIGTLEMVKMDLAEMLKQS